MGVATSRGVAYFDARGAQPAWWTLLGAALDQQGVVAFNAAFDYGWLYRYLGRHTKLVGCSFVLFRLACNEGNFAQRWDLGTAQRTVLRWPDTNKAALAELLEKHEIWNKGYMWKLADLEPEAFGRYCAEDADASWQLWNHILGQAQSTSLQRFATEEWVAMIRCLVETNHRGLDIDVAALSAYQQKLLTDIAAAEEGLRRHPALAGHIAEREVTLAVPFFASRFTVSRSKATKKDLEPCLVGLTYDRNLLAAKGWLFQPSQAKALPAWQQALGGYWYREHVREHLRNVGKPAPRFNFESDPDLRWLLFECVYQAEVLDVEGPFGRVEKRATVWIEDGQTVEAAATKSGLPPVSREILPALGEVGKLIGEFNRLTKLEGYVRSYLEHTKDGILHPRFKPAATLSGRLAGG